MTLSNTAAWFSFWLLGMPLKVLPVGTAYAVWTGIGAIGAAVLGIGVSTEEATRFVFVGSWGKIERHSLR